MTVLPGAPIDSATGLPTPTIAVATDGGVSVIKDDGTVESFVSSSSYTATTSNIYFQPNSSNIFFMGGVNHHLWADVNNLQNALEISSNPDTAIPMYWTNWTGNDKAVHTSTDRVRVHSSGVTFYKDYNKYAPTSSSNKSSVAYMTSKYNTGYMTGDIRGSWNVDTDTTTFSSVDGIANGVLGGGATGTITGGATDITSSSVSNVCLIVSNLSFEAGKMYSVTINRVTSDTTNYIYGPWTSSYALNENRRYNVGQNGSQARTFLATSNSTSLQIVGGSGYSRLHASEITIREAIPDRSVKGNGLAVHNAPTVSAVATGAELKCVDNSGSGYMTLPYSSNLDIFSNGGDYSISWWGVLLAGNTGWCFVTACDHWNNGNYWIVGAIGGKITVGGTAVHPTSINDGTWKYCVVQKVGNTLYSYVNGKLNGTSSYASQYHQAKPNTDFVIGGRHNNDGYSRADKGWNKLALLRHSATTLTAEQIKEIYEAEKPLFQANAKCTLGTYPSDSSSVTAMDYDDSTDLLHVGTSNGRSVFKGLRRVEQTVNNTTEIAAQGGLIVEEAD
jgi:hypothetical protein